MSDLDEMVFCNMREVCDTCKRSFDFRELKESPLVDSESIREGCLKKIEDEK